MRNDSDNDVRVTFNPEVESPILVDSGFPDVRGLAKILCVQGFGRREVFLPAFMEASFSSAELTLTTIDDPSLLRGILIVQPKAASER